MTKFKSTLCLLAASALLAGCASFNANTFNAETLAADTAKALTHEWNQYYLSATNGATTNQLAKLNANNDQVDTADRDLSKALTVLDQARMDYAVNSAATNKTAVLAALQTASAQSSNVVSLVKIFLPPPPTAPAKK